MSTETAEELKELRAVLAKLEADKPFVALTEDKENHEEKIRMVKQQIDGLRGEILSSSVVREGRPIPQRKKKTVRKRVSATRELVEDVNIGQGAATRPVVTSNGRVALTSRQASLLEYEDMGECWDYMEELNTGKLGRCNALLYGPWGTGKTRFAVNCCRNGQELHSITLSQESCFAEIFGVGLPDGTGQTVWNHAPGYLAWQDGGHLVINEIDEMEDNSALLALLDDPEVAKITLSSGETISPRDGFRCIATSNCHPSDLREALADRFPYKILVDCPSPGAMEVFPKELGQAVLNNYSNPESMMFSYREVRNWYEASVEGVPFLRAAKMVWCPEWDAQKGSGNGVSKAEQVMDWLKMKGFNPEEKF